LDLLGCDAQLVWSRVDGFLETPQAEPRNLIEIASFIVSERLAGAHGGSPASFGRRATLGVTWAEHIERFRVEGGYSRFPGEPASTYMTFLATSAYDLIGLTPPSPAALVDMVRMRRRPDGGFAEATADARSGVNPTAAAVAVLYRFHALDGDVASAVASFLRSMQRPDGGLAAHGCCLDGDLLSTCSGLVTLFILRHAETTLRLAGVARFARDLAVSGGGFLGARRDKQPDVEYTCYGVATVGLLSSIAVCRHECQGACPGCPHGRGDCRP
jgi:geranylgeranyl transferase type-2 subunit beta